MNQNRQVLTSKEQEYVSNNESRGAGRTPPGRQDRLSPLRAGGRERTGLSGVVPCARHGPFGRVRRVLCGTDGHHADGTPANR